MTSFYMLSRVGPQGTCLSSWGREFQSSGATTEKFLSQMHLDWHSEKVTSGRFQRLGRLLWEQEFPRVSCSYDLDCFKGDDDWHFVGAQVLCGTCSCLAVFCWTLDLKFDPYFIAAVCITVLLLCDSFFFLFVYPILNWFMIGKLEPPNKA